MKQNYNLIEAQDFITRNFYQSVVPSLQQYIRIPNLSRSYDPQWNTNGFLLKAANHIKSWIQKLQIDGLQVEVFHDQQYSPLIFTEVKGDLDSTIIFYGHFDKQPPFEGWDENKGALIPVIQDQKLYGRGGADDGYATYGSLLAIKAVKEQGIKIPRCIIITEGDEESGSEHMRHYIQKLKEKIGVPEYVFCLDSGILDYDRFWLTTSLRGNLVGTLRVQTLEQGVHSGDGSGVIGSCFRILNILFERLENVDTGKINDKFQVNIPANRYSQATRLLQLKGQSVVEIYPFAGNTKKSSQNLLECLINKTWRPALTVTGISGIPDVKNAGNVLIPCIEARFSLRLPPTLNHTKAIEQITKLLTQDPPYNSQVQLKNARAGRGWNSKDIDKFLENSFRKASLQYFKNENLSMAEGGSIPLMGMLSQLFPDSQLLITGVLGPNSNSHGPNEYLDLEYTRKLICSIASIMADISQNMQQK